MRMRKRKGRFLRLWATMSKKERELFIDWLRATEKHKLLEVLNVLAKHCATDHSYVSEGMLLKNNLPNIKYPYQVVDRIYNEALKFLSTYNDNSGSSAQFFSFLASALTLVERGCASDGLIKILQIKEEAEHRNVLPVIISSLTIFLFKITDLPSVDMLDDEQICAMMEELETLYKLTITLIKIVYIRNILNLNTAQDPLFSINKSNHILNKHIMCINNLLPKLEQYEQLSIRYPIALYITYIALFDIYFYLVHDFKRAHHYLNRLYTIIRLYRVYSGQKFIQASISVRKARFAIRFTDYGLFNHALDTLKNINEQHLSHVHRIYLMLFELWQYILQDRQNNQLYNEIEHITNHISKIKKISQFKITSVLQTELMLLYVYITIKEHDLTTAKNILEKLKRIPAISKYPFKQAYLFFYMIYYYLKGDKHHQTIYKHKLIKSLYKIFEETDMYSILDINKLTKTPHLYLSAISHSIKKYPILIELFELINPPALLGILSEAQSRSIFKILLYKNPNSSINP